MNNVNALMIGTGEYTTGYVDGAEARSDKGAGVVAISLIDLRRRGRIGRLSMAGTNGTKFIGIRRHMQSAIGETYRDMELQFDSFPDDNVARDPNAYQPAIKRMSPGDVVTIFTPDDTHFSIAMDAVRQGCHVLIAKPIVKTIAEHRELQLAAEENHCLVAMEVHKRWDPIYADARDRIRNFGDLSYFNSYMSQPKSQLDTFRAWAGKSSDISYYLNAHHIDFSVWAMAHRARPKSVYAIASTGVASSRGIDTEDTITLNVSWENFPSGNLGTACYTSSWIAPKSDVHSQQRFFFMGHHGEIQIDQAHRGYSQATDDSGFASLNPLFMKYSPNADGYFAGQSSYGYRSIEDFVEAAIAIRSGNATPNDYTGKLATIGETMLTTAILEAGRKSLDEGGKVVSINYESQSNSGQSQVSGLSID